jgi:hypothetical protein
VRTLILLLLLSGCPGDWRRRDTLLEAGSIGLTVLDWQQTRDITKNCTEINPVIGECGQRLNMHVYFVAVVALEILAARLADPDNRTLLHGAWIGVEGATTWRNWKTSE